MQRRHRVIHFRHGNKAQHPLLAEKSPYGARAKSTRSKKREAQLRVVRRQMESEQRTSTMILESVSQDRDIVCQEALNARDIFQKSERAAQLPRTEVQNLTHHSSRKLEKSVSTFTICMKESLRKTTNLLLKEIEHQSKNQRFFSRTLRLKNGETSSDPTKKRWTLSEHFPRLFCPTKNLQIDAITQ